MIQLRYAPRRLYDYCTKAIVQLESYVILSRQTVPGNKSVDEIVLVPSLSRALVLSGTSVHYLLLQCYLVHPLTVAL